jgi:transcriptional regulator with GAF, ATPase, and Fis domain
VPLEVRLDPKRSGFVRDHGFRAFLRTTLRSGEEKIGALVFSSTTPGRFHPGQFRLSRRLADLVAMALAHRRLADEAARAAEVRARAEVLEDRVQELVRQAEEREGLHRCVGGSAAWKEVLSQATRVASTDTTVLLTGESGTGKEVLARFLHRGSPRASGPLIAVNCAALPENLLESELFGYERGAFSGALSAKPGRIEQAARGVLFLDEIGEMSLMLQAKLLRVLQEKEFQRLGGVKTLHADIRVIAATNRDLVAAMKRGEFREDLFYRLRVFEIRMPPLRERRDDILPLTEAFLADLEKSVGRRTAGLSREAREILLGYDWPGNVRELRNALERAVILCDGGLITGDQLPLGSREPGAKEIAIERGEAPMTIDVAEKALIEKALAQARHNKSKAARLLGLSRAQLYFRLEKYGLAEPPR